ncbi:TetR/AcrR family transcriptional regulator [Pseudobacillus wudalianchiensis]|uniref:TetR family transcriptional regulator n=1 Tax=Pseudobacillus wudalianchiensis TaxID=1743143 RepID=A0A1B9AAK6_9BACI|nr:TetR/AcrR family transcriptional regulator [Bacillus wudalianchiensis]OCA80878.1 TetR family transcriptional regulator [Bacillus wudalianchiensis]
MKEKEKLVIETAIKLFAAKGFASTSIQEIAEEAGISKGAFYLYFKSKDELLYSTLQYYFDIIEKRLSLYEDQKLLPREKFVYQLKELIETLSEHKEFIIMQAREQAIPLNDEVKELLFRMHMESHKFYRDSLLDIYGKQIKPFVWDLSTMLDGIFHSYMKVILVDSDFDSRDIAEYIMKRMDNLAAGLSNDSPLLSEQKVADLLHKTKALFLQGNSTIYTILHAMKKELENMENPTSLNTSLEVLMEEAVKENPRIPVIQGMLSNFKDIPAFEPYRQEIAALYKFNL